MSVPAPSHTRPSAVATRPPAWMILPSHLSLPVFSNTGRTKLIGHVDGRVGLPGLQHRVHGASHGRVEQGGDPAPVHGAERVVEALRRRGLEHDAAALDLDDPDVGFHREGRRRLRAVAQALEKSEPRNPGCDLSGNDTDLDGRIRCAHRSHPLAGSRSAVSCICRYVACPIRSIRPISRARDRARRSAPRPPIRRAPPRRGAGPAPMPAWQSSKAARPLAVRCRQRERLSWRSAFIATNPCRSSGRRFRVSVVGSMISFSASAPMPMPS